MTTDDLGTVLHLQPKPPQMSPVQRADVWDGIVRMMEANGRTRLEISLDDARWIAALARRLACD